MAVGGSSREAGSPAAIPVGEARGQRAEVAPVRPEAVVTARGPPAEVAPVQPEPVVAARAEAAGLGFERSQET